MKKLEEKFRKGCREFQRLYSDERITIYQITMTYPTGAKDIYLEVFKPVICKTNIFVGEEYEKYPVNEEFGVRAWTITTMGSLRKILTQEFGFSGDEVIAIAENAKIHLP